MPQVFFPGERSTAGKRAFFPARLFFRPPASYPYLAASSCTTVAGVSDKEEFKHMREAMSAVGFPEERQVVTSPIW